MILPGIETSGPHRVCRQVQVLEPGQVRAGRKKRDPLIVQSVPAEVQPLQSGRQLGIIAESLERFGGRTACRLRRREPGTCL